jgi:hypothetical protein
MAQPRSDRIAGRLSFVISIEIAPVQRRILQARPAFRLLTQGRDSQLLGLPVVHLFRRTCATSRSGGRLGHEHHEAPRTDIKREALRTYLLLRIFHFALRGRNT